MIKQWSLVAWHSPTPNSHSSQRELLTGFKKRELGASGDHNYKYLEGWHEKEQNNDHLEQRFLILGMKRTQFAHQGFWRTSDKF